MGWVYNQTSGSILLMVLFHLGRTICWNFITLPEPVGQFRPDNLSTLLMGIVAVVVVTRTGMKQSSLAEQPLEQICTEVQKRIE